MFARYCAHCPTKIQQPGALVGVLPSGDVNAYAIRVPGDGEVIGFNYGLLSWLLAFDKLLLSRAGVFGLEPDSGGPHCRLSEQPGETGDRGEPIRAQRAIGSPIPSARAPARVPFRTARISAGSGANCEWARRPQRGRRTVRRESGAAGEHLPGNAPWVRPRVVVPARNRRRRRAGASSAGVASVRCSKSQSDRR